MNIVTLKDITISDNKVYTIDSKPTPLASVGQVRKVRAKELNMVLNDFSLNEWITIHEDDKCIFAGLKRNFI